MFMPGMVRLVLDPQSAVPTYGLFERSLESPKVLFALFQRACPRRFRSFLVFEPLGSVSKDTDRSRPT